MTVSITFRHMESTEAIKTYVREKLERVQKYARAPLDGQVTLYQERHQFVAETSLQVAGRSYQATQNSDDMYKSIDQMVDKLEHQISKAHDTAARNKKGAERAAVVGANATGPIEGDRES